MHFELPKTSLHSLRDFAKHYLMIVLSILTALGLEAWIEHTHHQHAAQAASARIEAEIRLNRDAMREALQADVEQSRRLGTIQDAIIRDFQAHETDDAIRRHIQSLIGAKFNLNLQFPTLRHEAWDVAVADQSASWIDHAQMQRFSTVYANQREVVTDMGANTSLLLSGTHLIDLETDLRIGRVQPLEFLHVSGQMVAILDNTSNNLRTLAREFDAALPASNASL